MIKNYIISILLIISFITLIINYGLKNINSDLQYENELKYKQNIALRDTLTKKIINNKLYYQKKLLLYDNMNDSIINNLLYVEDMKQLNNNTITYVKTNVLITTDTLKFIDTLLLKNDIDTTIYYSYNDSVLLLNGNIKFVSNNNNLIYQNNIVNNQIKIKLNYNIFYDEITKIPVIEIHSPIKNVEITDIKGVFKHNETIKRRKKWIAISPQIGYGVILNPTNLKLHSGVYLGLGVSFNVIELFRK